MHSSTRLVACLPLVCAVACGVAPEGAALGTALGEGRLHLRMQGVLKDAAKVRVDVTRDGNSVTAQDLEVASQPVPGDANHIIGHGGDALFVLLGGTYGVTATPLAQDGNALSLCQVASQDGVEVKKGEVTEVTLVIQCDDTNSGLLDAAVLIESAPTLETFTITPSKFPSVDTPVAIAAGFKDAQGDAIAVTVDVLQIPDDAKPEVTVKGAEISFKASTPGDYALQITGKAPMGTATTQKIVIHVQPAFSQQTPGEPAGSSEPSEPAGLSF